MKIIFSGGGTLGSVTPLIALAEIIKNKYHDANFLWIGTPNGPEKKLIEDAEIKFVAISSGKLRRYISFWNLTDLFKICVGVFQAFFLLIKEKPDLAISAGGFVSVPTHFVAWCLGIPTWVHQQDIKIGLANKIMAIFATQITVSLEKNIKDFPSNKVKMLGNPIRKIILSGDRQKAIKKFNLNPNLKTIFAIGGGTGSARLNQLIIEAIPHLNAKYQIIHLTGIGLTNNLQRQNYYPIEFAKKEIADIYEVADIIVSRGGFGVISEVASKNKPLIIVPKAGQQELNAEFLASLGAAISLNENTTNGQILAQEIQNLLENKETQTNLVHNLKKALPVASDQNVLAIFDKIVKK